MSQPIKSVLFIGLVEFISTKNGKTVKGPLYCCAYLEDGQLEKGGLFINKSLDKILEHAQSALQARLARKAVFGSPHGFIKNSEGTRLYKFAELSYGDLNTVQRVLSG